MSAPLPPATTPGDCLAIVVRPSLLKSGLVEYAILALFGIACIALLAYAGGPGPLSDATDTSATSRRISALPLVLWGALLLPVYVYALVKGATTRITLTGDGMRARPRRFGWDLLRSGAPPLLPWSHVTAVTAQVGYVGTPPAARPVLDGVQIVGATRQAYWKVDLTPDMTSWSAAMAFLLEHVDPKAVAPDVWRLLPQNVTARLGPSVWPRPTPEQRPRGFLSRLIR